MATTTPTTPATPSDPRRTRAWRKLRDQVVLEDPECQLRLAGCTRLATTADHIKHYTTHPELAMERSNLRGSCETCNKKRGKKTDEELGAARDAAARPRALDIFRRL
jgi:5-methylcytosine-specific restriction endonuclease McrA